MRQETSNLVNGMESHNKDLREAHETTTIRQINLNQEP